MKRILICLVVLVSVSFSGFAVELSSLTVDGNYWFGKAQGFSLVGPADYTHNSLSLTSSARLSPGFVLSADYTFGKRSKPVVDGEEIEIPPDVSYSSQQHLFSASAGYPLSLAPGLDLTASLGWGYYASKEMLTEGEYSMSLDITASRPQISLAAQFKVTPEFSLRGNIATFLGTAGTITTSGGTTGVSQADSEQNEIQLKLMRWQLEGKYNIQPGWEALAGYRAWNIEASGEDGEEKVDLDSTGFYLGVRYSY